MEKEIKIKGTKWVVIEDCIKCTNCYYYGTPCNNCNQQENILLALMTFEEYNCDLVSLGQEEYVFENYQDFLVDQQENYFINPHLFTSI